MSEILMCQHKPEGIALLVRFSFYFIAFIICMIRKWEQAVNYIYYKMYEFRIFFFLLNNFTTLFNHHIIHL